jgi:hypothetical protein
VWKSLHGGYGDRTDQIVTEAITPHVIVVIVEGQVISAIMDDRWDELNQALGNEHSIMTPQETPNSG